MTGLEREVKRRAEDEARVGTPAYKGDAWFWNHRYRHVMRDASKKLRRKVHKAFVKAGLSPDGSTKKHDAIVTDVTGENYNDD